MTDNKFFPDFISLKKLFDEGICLTYNPLDDNTPWKYAMDLKEEYRNKHKDNPKCIILSKTAKLLPDNYRHNFHFFSHGVLIHNILNNDVRLKNIITALKIRGYGVKEIYGPENQIDFFKYDAFLNQITQYAKMNYPYQDDFQVVPWPSKEQFIEQCFANNNVLLTASKFENIDPSYRKYLALFADGQFYISSECGGFKRFSSIIWRNFKKQYDDYVYCNSIAVSPQTLEAIYKKAKERDWFLAENVGKINNTSHSEKNSEMDAYVNGIVKNRYCLSIIPPEVEKDFFISPDEFNFVLFSDGTLLLDENRKYEHNIILHQLRQAFPEMNFKVESISQKYIEAVYRKLQITQKTARQISLEILKQKAKKIKKMLGIPHHEALDIVAQICDWPNWKKIIRLSESEARHFICVQKHRKYNFQWCLKNEKTKAKSLEEWEYQEFLQFKENLKEK